ncbi:aerobic carbon monoxide dehydrogenase [Halosimplex carlsbadense 2-9-1]|uniref:Aerobic carbon monoxide dehydrogenase n=1 Tax=Halosimplex carlsbadense 2-9-1 TaxID=797114 RepID=M0CC91_9EURY|nr:(2Fe-2S)-binding protein [Halosimplex carlsbadense]ELZ19967.1 aerobic carbon monoxide dehydrogenase [Halosimplex carlsbadense 2-9-1]
MSIDETESSPDRPTREISLTVNGDDVTTEVEPRLKLSDFLRHHVDLNGVRVGCEHGVCGACTVSVDGDLVKSCMMYAVQTDDSEVLTVEGLGADGSLHPVQEAFHEEHALQCGFCTSGFVMSARDLLADNPDPSQEEMEAHLSSNICRCTGYQNIYDAVERAADKMEGD